MAAAKHSVTIEESKEPAQMVDQKQKQLRKNTKRRKAKNDHNKENESADKVLNAAIAANKHILQQEKESKLELLRAVHSSQLTKTNLSCTDCPDYPHFANQGKFRQHMKQAHNIDSLFEDLSEVMQLRSINSIELYAKVSPFAQIDCDEVKQSLLPCGCKSK